jgi:hypothetical protein
MFSLQDCTENETGGPEAHHLISLLLALYLTVLFALLSKELIK